MSSTTLTSVVMMMLGLHKPRERARAGRVILPLDLLGCEPQHRAAMLRAFGGSVIAADSATAAELAAR